MLKILQADVKKENPAFVEAKRRGNEDNLKWLARNLPKGGGTTHIVLIGGRIGADFRLRVAQSHVRHDLTPSHWSHTLLLTNSPKSVSATRVVEISLTPPRGFGFPAETNGAQQGTLRTYQDPGVYPNIAVISIPVAPAKILRSLERYKTQRAVLDSVELLVMWLAFVWGVGRTGNPLLDGNGIPSAAMIEVVVSSSGYELTPGLTSRSSCPEAIWQSAKWWYEFYQKEKRESLSGAWCVDHKLV